MQQVVVAKPYTFVPPHRGTLWPTLLRALALRRILHGYGVVEVECRGVARLRASIDAGHGIVLAPNHCRPVDPFVVAILGRDVGRHLFIMASWHLFMQSRLKRFLLPRAGVFSIYREGLDRDALNCAVEILTEARRPLVVFPEGAISRHNDRLSPMMDGVALMARAAARRRNAVGRGSVVVHPVAIRYLFAGDAEAVVAPILDDLERGLTWEPATGEPAVPRIARIASAVLALKEMAYVGGPGAGSLPDRVQRLIDHLLCPLEREWLRAARERGVIGRVKALRSAILKDMVNGALADDETARRWRHLRDVQLAQQLSLYPADYLAGTPPPERIVEMAEKLEEDLTDDVRHISPFRAVVDVGEPIEVPPDRARGTNGDGIMSAVRSGIQRMLAASLAERWPGAAMCGD
jgi:1-acyl-sn-glycerol-3-phosphate acyltransferase